MAQGRLFALNDSLNWRPYSTSMQRVAAVCLALILLSAQSSGCFSDDGEVELVPAGDLTVSPSQLVGAQLQSVEFAASSPMVVHVPYLVLDRETGLFTNGTNIHFGGSGSQTIEMIAPPNIQSAFFLLAGGGAFPNDGDWPIRSSNQSWQEWFDSEEFLDEPYYWVEHPVLPENRSGFSPEEGSLYGTVIIDGLSAYEWL